jgi:hypothetical protein
MSHHHGDTKKKLARFRRLDTAHISAIESLSRRFPFLRDRVEVHMPYHRAKPAFQSGPLWVWPKFDKRPVGFLVFLEDFPPCIWYPDRQEGMALRWIVPPLFCEKGATVCLANLLPSESVLQVEDLLIHQGTVLWTHMTFSKRWEALQEFWGSLPADQPLLGVTPRLVAPICLEDWPHHYDFAIYWIIQPDHAGQPRWFWKDVVTPHAAPTYVAPQMKRNAEVTTILCAYCTPYSKMVLPDLYTLQSQEGDDLGLASISTLELSLSLRKQFSGEDGTSEAIHGVAAEVKWNDVFKKYQILRIMPSGTPITAQSFFHHADSSS